MESEELRLLGVKRSFFWLDGEIPLKTAVWIFFFGLHGPGRLGVCCGRFPRKVYLVSIYGVGLGFDWAIFLAQATITVD